MDSTTLTHNQCKINWEEWEDAADEVTGYTIGLNDLDAIECGPGETTKVISGLTPATEYNVKIR